LEINQGYWIMLWQGICKAFFKRRRFFKH